ncbi:hypothetical protein GEMRC1_003212 [Eukaryota sp. GEM-RC1]
MILAFSYSEERTKKNPIDNFAGHKLDDASVAELSNLELLFLPANTTSRLQPLDQGIIRSWKSKYRNRFKRVAATGVFRRGIEYSLKDAVDNLTDAWNQVTQTVIVNCWRKAGFGDDLYLRNSVSQDDDAVFVSASANVVFEEDLLEDESQHIQIERGDAIADSLRDALGLEEHDLDEDLRVSESVRRPSEERPEQGVEISEEILTSIQHFLCSAEQQNVTVEQLHDMTRALNAATFNHFNISGGHILSQ